ncbi:hypothetical protein J1605_003611 [Eschrichtius robustus]|uniref:Uncharacterized protein n=1 Tax=Eschrichtius robustus TaxID=9764 RepID=A0AB34HR91_ESCRO|nr:hypothetical protein J1605_003611 [Eschrichtius robustus]
MLNQEGGTCRSQRFAGSPEAGEAARVCACGHLPPAPPPLLCSCVQGRDKGLSLHLAAKKSPKPPVTRKVWARRALEAPGRQPRPPPSGGTVDSPEAASLLNASVLTPLIKGLRTTTSTLLSAVSSRHRQTCVVLCPVLATQTLTPSPASLWGAPSFRAASSRFDEFQVLEKSAKCQLLRSAELQA